MIHYIWMFVVGIVVGLIARALLPGAQQMGLIMTGLVGIAGSFVGGLLSRLFSKPPEGSPVHPAGILMSVVGAIVLLFVCSRLGLHL